MKNINYFTFLNNRLSIQKFLSICLILLITCSIFILGIFNYYKMRQQNEDLFKMQMVNSANAIDALLSAAVKDSSKRQLSDLLKSNSLTMLDNIADNLKPKVAQFDNVYQDSFAFQVYDRRNGNLLLHSTGSPEMSTFQKGTLDTFQTMNLKTAKGMQAWNMFSINSRYQPYRIVVLVSSDFKHQMFLNLFRSAIWDLVILYVFLLFSIFVIVQLALRPLSDIRRAIAVKDPRKPEPIAIKTAPPEVLPLLNQLNTLFQKISKVLDREKRFASDAAHELKTPLAALKTQAEVALNLNDIDEIKKKIANIISGADRYFYIIDQLLTLSRLEPQQDLPNKQQVNANIVAENQLADLALLALHKNIDLQFMPSKESAYVFASEALLGVLFRNLIDNAIRYTQASGKVTLYSYVTKDTVIFEVVDNGIGIAEDKQKRIFDRFYREVGTGQAGSGLGLSIAKEIVRLHDGQISARTSEGGQGLTLMVSFPYCKVTTLIST
ncbi:ATP-binding protein [Fastidiosibacter lacustris]|uniref:ATP-binding protein n=1 Tax=Fastidiosibacter lacustris TaxID=2056695 RepID=UPI000E344D87|nr:ATP-binding protein [Fastidiosibacter lacustris]